MSTTTNPTPATPSVSATLPALQSRVREWTLDCFGDEIACDMQERMDRFTEEALELAQSLGYDADRAHALVNYVFGRDKGEPSQEVGGTMTTLAALCNVAEIDILTAFAAEVARITQPEMVLKIRAKQAAKPTGSALPVATPSVSVESEERKPWPKGCIGYMPDYQAGGDCVNCGRVREDHAEFAAPAPNPSPAAKSGEAEALKACPFCSEANLLTGVQFGHDGVECISCGAIGPRGDDAEDAQERWNDRAALTIPSPQPADAVREAPRPPYPICNSYMPDYQAGGDCVTRGRMREDHAEFAALTEPAPAGEAVEPVAYQQRNRLDGVWSDWYPSSKKAFEESEAGPVACYEVRPLYAHPAPGGTARLREDLERVTLALSNANDRLETLYADHAAEKYRADTAERDRDDARKALSWLIKDTLGPDDYSPRRSYTLTVSGKAIIDAQVAARSASREATR